MARLPTNVRATETAIGDRPTTNQQPTTYNVRQWAKSTKTFLFLFFLASFFLFSLSFLFSTDERSVKKRYQSPSFFYKMACWLDMTAGPSDFISSNQNETISSSHSICYTHTHSFTQRHTDYSTTVCVDCRLQTADCRL